MLLENSKARNCLKLAPAAAEVLPSLPPVRISEGFVDLRRVAIYVVVVVSIGIHPNC
jgi:uncharacterized membrane protein (DUF4010 family)